jgi:hypothetical protein
VDSHCSVCARDWEIADDVARVMQFSQIPLLGGIDELHGHFRVGKRLEQVHWHGGLLSFSFGKCYGEWSMVLVGDAEHRLKAQAHASGSSVPGEGS